MEIGVKGLDDVMGREKKGRRPRRGGGDALEGPWGEKWGAPLPP